MCIHRIAGHTCCPTTCFLAACAAQRTTHTVGSQTGQSASCRNPDEAHGHAQGSENPRGTPGLYEWAFPQSSPSLLLPPACQAGRYGTCLQRERKAKANLSQLSPSTSKEAPAAPAERDKAQARCVLPRVSDTLFLGTCHGWNKALYNGVGGVASLCGHPQRGSCQSWASQQPFNVSPLFSLTSRNGSRLTDSVGTSCSPELQVAATVVRLFKKMHSKPCECLTEPTWGDQC